MDVEKGNNDRKSLFLIGSFVAAFVVALASLASAASAGLSLDSNNENFKWQTGNWGICWSKSGCGQGSEERTVWCGDTKGRPVPSYLCKSNEKPLHNRQCFTACKGQWKVGMWSKCKLESGSRLKQNDGLCLGSRYRNVTCQSSLSKKPDSCPDSIPPSKVSCYTICPQDCVVGPWTMWTPCGSCRDRKYRTRLVIIGPDHGGSSCPTLSESEPCFSKCLNETITISKDLTFLSYFETSTTVLEENVSSVDYSQTSSIPESTSTTVSSKPQEISKTHHYKLPKLRVGEWGECSVKKGTGKHRNKNSKKILNSQSNLIDQKTKNLNEDPFETHLEWEIRDALSLIGENTRNVDQIPEYLSPTQLEEIDRKNFEYPRVGIQERNLTCVGTGGEIRPLGECVDINVDLNSLVYRSCIISIDCQLTEWSEWKTVTQGCVAPNGQVIREVKERRRIAISLQVGNGSPCPHLLEHHTVPEPSLQPCNSMYQWLASSWGPCLSTVGPAPKTTVSCGGGVQKRDITCVKVQGKIPVEGRFCHHVEPPPRYQRCEIGCERDCILGPWSAWGICTPRDCSSIPLPTTPGFRRRIREVIVSPSTNGTECPPLEEQTECQATQCHQWLIGSWSECFVDNKNKMCGKGHIVRNITCVDSDGNIAPNEECQIELGTVESRQQCHVPCPFDCVLAPWSEWTPCSKACADTTSVGYTHRNTTILAPNGPGGKECPAPDELTEVKTCREEPCAGAAWVPGEWGVCLPESGSSCGTGSQIRPLFCIDMNTNEQLENFRCAGLSQPRQERSCEVQCGRECSLSEWSEWSECKVSKPCFTVNRTIASKQTRWRRVIVHPSVNKRPCEHIYEERSCVLHSGLCKVAEFETGEWSGCALTNGIKCGTGFRVRDVHCVNGSGDKVDPTECLLGDKIIPESSEECYVSCDKPCILSTWSKWTSCPKDRSCDKSFSYRTRKLLDGTERNTGCQNIIVKETKECPCMTYYSESGSSWSDCLLGPPIKFVENKYRETFSAIKTDKEAIYPAAMLPATKENNGSNSLQENLSDFCGVGTRYRSLKCLREDKVLANPSFCGHKGIEWEPCMLDCPSDCLVDHWGDWTICNSSCGAGIQKRYREVVQMSFSNGRKCPEAEQERACWGSCETRWISQGWDECQLAENSECGTGLQQRTVKCVQLLSSGMEKVVEDQMCDRLLRPNNIQPCRVYCPGECVVSNWSEWNVCPEGCPETKIRLRTRNIIRFPSNESSPCPHLKEEEPCLTGVSCWKYSWFQGNWTSCVPLGRSSCGEGSRNRPVSCVRSDGTNVKESFCERETRPAPQEKWCYVDCPIDCQVTTWTEWDDSKCSCGERPGSMKRRRYILVNPSDSGRVCPANVEETLPCPVIPCYTWERSPWSECKLMGGNCGHGVMERHVRCIGPGGVNVSPDKCLALVHVGGHTWPYLAHALDLNTKDGCYVPCEGDCELTEWSSWSHCHRDCSRGAQGGTQTRSRAIISGGSTTPCPGPLWQNRPCVAGPCLTYSWQVVHGTAACIRSDGLVVTGGCGDTPKPCIPECKIPGSLCSPVGVCVCRPGLRPHYSESMRYRLNKCIPSFNMSLISALPIKQARYLPETINGWMFALIGVGSAFVIFVVISVYLMCKTPHEQTQIPLTLRRTTLHQNNSAQSS